MSSASAERQRRAHLGSALSLWVESWCVELQGYLGPSLYVAVKCSTWFPAIPGAFEMTAS